MVNALTNAIDGDPHPLYCIIVRELTMGFLCNGPESESLFGSNFLLMLRLFRDCNSIDRILLSN